MLDVHLLTAIRYLKERGILFDWQHVFQFESSEYCTASWNYEVDTGNGTTVVDFLSTQCGLQIKVFCVFYSWWYDVRFTLICCMVDDIMVDLNDKTCHYPNNHRSCVKNGARQTFNDKCRISVLFPAFNICLEECWLRLIIDKNI